MAGTTRFATASAWQLPARQVSLLHRGLRPYLDTDARVLERLGLPPLAPALAVVGIVVLFAIGHLINTDGAPGGNEPYRILIRDVFTESMPYMILAVALGLLAPTLGVLFVTVHVLTDIPVSLMSPGELEPLPLALVGRAVSWWLLWLLAVEIPVTARSVGPRVNGALAGRPGLQLPGAALATALAAGVLAWVWTQAVTILIRPAFTWTNQFSPTYGAIAPAQETGIILALAAAAVGGVAAWSHLRSDPLAGLPLFAEPSTWPAGVPRIVGDVAAAVLLTVALGGVITGALDIAILFGALLGARPAARWIHQRLGVGQLLAPIPWLVRYVAGFLATYGIGLIVIPPLFDVFIGTEFLPLVITIALGMIVFEFLLAEPRDLPPAERRVGAGTAALMLVAGGLGFLALAGPVSADNCSGRFDCYPAPFVAAGGSAAAAAAAAANRRNGPPPPPDKKPLEQARRATGMVSKAPGGSHLSIPKFLVGKLIGWQLDTAGEISRQMGGDPPRTDFTEVERAVPIALPPELTATDGLPAPVADAMRRMAEAQATAIGHGRAAIVSFDRYGGARQAGDRYWIARQAVTVIEHKKAWGRALADAAAALEGYLEALRAQGIESDLVSVEDARAEHERLRTHGLEPEELAACRALGATEDEIETMRAARLATPPEQMAGDRLARLADVAAAYRAVAGATEALPMPPDPGVAPEIPQAA